MSSARQKSSGSRKSGTRSSGKKKSSGSSTKEVAGLRTLVQKRLLHDMFTYCSDNFQGWMVLVVDKKAMRSISSAVGMYDIMERKVTLVEDIEKKRAPFRDMAAIYVLAPTEDSVNRLIEDFSETPLYGKAVFLFFLGRLSPKQLDKIKECRPLVKRIKALSEANIDFLAKELRAFHFDMRRDFTHMYVRRGGKKVENRIAEKLISVCSTLNEYPYIRFANDSPVASAVASQLAARLDNFVRNDEFWFHGDSSHADRERATLLILDRKDDCLTPLMHDFTYQSMVKDLLDVKDDDKITLVQDGGGVDDDVYDDDYDSDWDDEDDDDDEEGGREKKKSEPSPKANYVDAKDILLNEDDNIWVELRGKHIAEVIETLSDRCREMVNSDTSGFSNKDKGKTMSLSQMASALKALPEYKEVMAKLSQHMQIAHECMDEFNKRKLFDLSELEQTLATGEREDGSKPKLADLMDEVKKALKSTSDPRARLRLLLITIVSQGGLKDEYKSSLYRAAKVDPNQEKMLMIMQENLDISLQNANSETGAFNKLQSAFGKQEINTRLDSDATFANSRYVPPLKHILEDLVENTLDTDNYPSARANDIPTTTAAVASARRKPEGSARKGGATSRWQRSNQKEGTKDETYAGGRIIVFVVGGISFAELRVAREVMAKAGKEIIAGSTIFSKPNDFVDDLRRLSGKRRDSTRESTKSSS